MPRPTRSLEFSVSGVAAGVDEAGCGPWAGPVVAAAVILNPRKHPPGMNDSKTLTIERREKLYDAISACAHTAVGIADVCEIDTLNILEAARLAMRRAVEGLGIVPELVLIDGNRPPALPYPVKTVIGGDGKCLSIAAASIIAKVTRDRAMQALAAEYPGYGWETNAGYGTKQHQAALVRLGVTPHHRRSFAPVCALLEATDLFSAA